MKKLYNPENGQMKVAGLMSGSGSNLKKIIEFERLLEKERGESPYKVELIFTDNPKCNAVKIGREFDIPVVGSAMKDFYKHMGKPINDLKTREIYDSITAQALNDLGIHVAAYAGYMRIATKPLINAVLGVNVHPADLTIIEKGKRKYTGAHAVRDAIIAGETMICSTTHIIEEEVDGGRILLQSKPLDVMIKEDFDPEDKAKVKQVEEYNQERLKYFGDWIIFPKTLLYLAEGRYEHDENGKLFFDKSGLEITNIRDPIEYLGGIK